MKILITGAAGFVGSRLALKLLQRGDEVIGVDNLTPYYPVIHKERNLQDLRAFSQFSFFPIDLRSYESLEKLFQGTRPDSVAHLAAMAAVRYSVEHPLIYGEVNVQGSMNLLEAGRKSGVNYFSLASTGSVYGSTTPVPFVEDAAADRPLAAYPASKRAMELFAHSYFHLYGIESTVLRFFNVYGPHGRPDMMPWQWSQAISKGVPITLFDGGFIRRDWTYIDDIVNGFVASIDKPLGYEVMNLGCGNPVENRRFVEVIESIVGKKAAIEEVPAPKSEPKVTFASIEKANQLLGYAPKVQVEEGLKNFITWKKSEGLL